jgi:hypothetical protein
LGTMSVNSVLLTVSRKTIQLKGDKYVGKNRI